MQESYAIYRRKSKRHQWKLLGLYLSREVAERQARALKVEYAVLWGEECQYGFVEIDGRVAPDQAREVPGLELV